VEYINAKRRKQANIPIGTGRIGFSIPERFEGLEPPTLCLELEMDRSWIEHRSFPPCAACLYFGVGFGSHVERLGVFVRNPGLAVSLDMTPIDGFLTNALHLFPASRDPHHDSR
jgi:hypothetical protein